MKVLNVGCGTKTSDHPSVINIDWSIYLRLKKIKLVTIFAPYFLSGERLERFNNLRENIKVSDLSKGIPYPDQSVDVVYHSHLLEHLDRGVAEEFLLEVKRVLKPGGVHRIVVPDLEFLCKEYLEHLNLCESDEAEALRHDDYIDGLLEQSVRRESSGSSKQARARRFIENFLLGDARKRGETHQWMYDRVSLASKLVLAGYQNVTVQSFDESYIQDWSVYGLDLNSKGEQYVPNSLYVEAIK